MKTTNILLGLLIFVSTKSFSQFDIINTDPVAKNPAFVGSTGSHRLLTKLSSLQQQVNFNYDFFSKKLKGGWGINTTRSQLFISDYPIFNTYNEWENNLSYSPKITLGNSKITWAPGFRISHKKNWAIESIYSEEDSTSTDRTINDKNIFGASLGLTANTTNYLTGGYVEYHPSTKQIEAGYQYFRQFNKNTEKRLSSTLGSTMTIHNDNRIYTPYKAYISGYRPLDDYNEVEKGNIDLSLNIKYALKYKKILFGVSADIPLIARYTRTPIAPKFEIGYYGKHFQFLSGITRLGYGSYVIYTLKSTISFKF